MINCGFPYFRISKHLQCQKMKVELYLTRSQCMVRITTVKHCFTTVKHIVLILIAWSNDGNVALSFDLYYITVQYKIFNAQNFCGFCNLLLICNVLLRIVCGVIQSYTGDGHTRESFFHECYQGDVTMKVLSLNLVLYSAISAVCLMVYFCINDWH